MEVKSSWNKGKNKSNDKSVLKISETFKRLKIDNFKNWRHNARLSGIIPNTQIKLKRDSNLSFLVGITLGDGNINQMERTQCLRITLGTDKPDLWKYTSKVIEKVFSKKPSVYKRKIANCVNVTIYQNNLSERLGIPIGARKDKVIIIPDWIVNNKTNLISFIKGLYEAEASFSVHKKTYTYNLSFSNMNISILNFLESNIKQLGFHPERRTNAVRIRRKIEAYEFMDLISFRKYPLL